MAVVHIPSMLRPLAGGALTVRAEGSTLRHVIEALEALHPALRGRITDAGGLRPEVMLAIGGDEQRNLSAPVAPEDDVFILPAIAGG